MTYVLKVSKPGKSVFSANPRDRSMDSAFQAVMRLVNSASGNTAIASASPGQVTTVTIPHNLGYAPFFQVFVAWDDGFGTVTEPENWTTGGLDPFYADVTFTPKVDAANLYLRWHNASPSYALSCFYWAFIGRDPVV